MNDLADRIAGLSPERRALLERRLREARPSGGGTIPRRSDRGPAPLSFAQQRLWFLTRYAPDVPLYNAPLALRLTGELAVDDLRAALGEIVRRHEVLRSRIELREGEPVQVLEPGAEPELALESLEALPAESREREALRIAREEGTRPFDLEAETPLRARLLRLAPNDHLLLLTLHHIATDGWSNGILLRELAALYGARRAGRPSPLAELPLQYADFAVWQREWLSGPELERQAAYWRRKLAVSPPVLDLPADRPRPAAPTYAGARESFDLPPSLVEQLHALGHEEGATLFMTLLAAFKTLLHRYTGEEDVAVGTPIANRGRTELEGLVGFFVNTLVLRTELGGQPTFRELLRRVKETALDAYAHQDLPFEKLVETLQPERSQSHTPLFQVMFALQNAPREEVEMAGLRVERLPAPAAASPFDLTLSLAEAPEGLRGLLEYRTELFDRERITRLAGHYRRLLEAIAADPDRSIARLPLLTERERRQLLAECRDTAVDHDLERCAHELFEARADAAPDAPALRFEGAVRSYAELEAGANRLARFLARAGVGPGVLVGLCVDRGFEMVEAMLGILKAGGAYLPLDPGYPPDRLAFMLADSGAPVVVTRERLLPLLPAGARAVCVDRDGDAIEQESPARPAAAAGPRDLAYVIYTSGSTGRPKGALIEHRGLVNLVAEQARCLGVGAGCRVLQFSSLSFDAATFETVMAVCLGGTLCLAPREALLPGPELLRFLREERINVVTLPPSALAPVPVEPLPELHTITVAGEACPRELAARWAPGRRFFNLYGPTETTICSTCARIQAGEQPTIGRPIGNIEVYLLDRNLEPVLVGVAGELCIGGVGLARGYLNRPELTAEKFVPHPFRPEEGPGLQHAGAGPGLQHAGAGPGLQQAGAGARLYRSGDLARRLPDGRLQFLGRIDDQVKLRGFRIEPGEIEAALALHPGVSETAVVLREDSPGSARLVAYYVARGEDPGPSALRSFLAEHLPDYMVPAHFVRLETMPVTPNHKVDRKALPPPEGPPAGSGGEVPPGTPDEERLAAIFAEVLGRERVGVEAGFFDLGGHSLMVTRVIARIRASFGVEVPVRTFFAGPTVRAVASVLQTLQATDAPRRAISRISREQFRRRIDGA